MSAAMRRALVIVPDSAGCGHAPDAAGYGDEGADTLGHADLVILTADHGNDPYHHGTDHTREQVPLRALGLAAASQAGIFADVRAWWKTISRQGPTSGRSGECEANESAHQKARGCESETGGSSAKQKAASGF